MKPSLVTSEQKQWGQTDLVGGKGSGLLKLVALGVPVPHFVILTTEAPFSDETKIKELLSHFLSQHTGDTFIVRSSADVEDKKEHSFAGIFETEINLSKDQLYESIQRVHLSSQAEKAKTYLENKGLSTTPRLAVIIQVMVDFDYRGVSFSRSPVAPTSTSWIDIENLKTHETMSCRMSLRNEVLEKHSDKKLTFDSKSLSLINQQTLDLSIKLGFPVDIEWGIKNKELWILQARPITQEFSKISVLVDTNLAESYSGVTSPLTYSLVKKMYAQVLREAAKTMHFSNVRNKHLESALPNLIQHLNWHLYYDIESYYTILGNLPTGERNIEEWHEKLGGKVFGVDSNKFLHRYGKIEILHTLWGMIKIIFKQEQVFRGFMAELQNHKINAANEIDQVKTAEEGWELLDRLMGRSWGLGLSVINDIFIVVGLRVLNKILLDKGYKESDLPLLLKTDLELHALRPIEELNHLKRKMTQKSWDVLVRESESADWDDPYRLIYQKLRDYGEGAFARDLESFIVLHGERCFEEFKLESLSLAQSPSLLVKLLDSFRGDKNPYSGISSKPVAITLNPWQRWILQFTRRSLDWRETTRSKRTQIYHLLRKLIVKSAVMMKNNESIFRTRTLRDFFSLTSEEWGKWARKEISSYDVIALMDKREVWKHLEKSYPEVYFHVEGEDFYQYSAQHTERESQLKGIGASPGEVTGRALVLQHPEEAFLVKDIEERILVTKNADPAWVYVMVRAKGLVSEKGTILGHTAILGRELKLTTVVGVPQVTSLIKNGESITINGTTGEVFFPKN